MTKSQVKFIEASSINSNIYFEMDFWRDQFWLTIKYAHQG